MSVGADATVHRFKADTDAPRVLIANSHLAVDWAASQHLNELDRKGAMRGGQMTAASWIDIRSQDIVQRAHEIFAKMSW